MFRGFASLVVVLFLAFLGVQSYADERARQDAPDQGEGRASWANRKATRTLSEGSHFRGRQGIPFPSRSAQFAPDRKCSACDDQRRQSLHQAALRVFKREQSKRR